MSHTSTMSVLVTFHDLARQAPQTMSNLERCARAAQRLGGPSGADRLQFVLVDDASSDNTAEVLAERLPSLPNARLHVNEGNAGVGACRNTAMELAEGDFMAFLDGDDFVDPAYYVSVLDSITDLGCDFVRTDHVEVVGKERTLRRIPDRNRGGRVGDPRDSIAPAHLLTAIDHPNVWAGAFHKSLVHRDIATFRTDLQASEDRLWTWQLFLGAQSFSIPEAIGPHYRRDIPTSLSRVSDGRQLDSIVAMDAIVALVSADVEADRFLPKAVRRHLQMSLHSLNESDRFSRSLAATFRKRLADSLVRLPEPWLSQSLAAMGPEQRQRLTTLMKAGRADSGDPAGEAATTEPAASGSVASSTVANSTTSSSAQATSSTATPAPASPTPENAAPDSSHSDTSHPETTRPETSHADTPHLNASGPDSSDAEPTTPKRSRLRLRRNR